jgi:hypothetical protein
MKIGKFSAELKRRNVYKVAFAYAVKSFQRDEKDRHARAQDRLYIRPNTED